MLSRAYPVVWNVNTVKAQEKETIIDIRLTQIEANEDWTESQRSGPILAKTTAAKEEDKRSITNEISLEGPLTKAYSAQWDSLRLTNRCLHRHGESADGKFSSNLIVVPFCKMKLAEDTLGWQRPPLERLKQRFYWVDNSKQWRIG